MSKPDALLAAEECEAIIAPVADRLEYRCDGTKPYVGELSPGCVACSEGQWSCMFLTPRCTASCAGCPQDPKTKIPRPPMAEGLELEAAEHYVEYLRKFGYTCTGLCGGEPFLVYEKLLSFVGTIKRRLGDAVYVYAYTNGDLATEEKLRALDEAGLDEIRFNISARGYKLDPVALAAGICRRVTVEVPAVPEDFEVLRDSLGSLEKLGVANLNVHQLFTTRFNYDTFVERKYTAHFRNSFDQLHLPGVGILESEVAALKLLRHVIENDIGLSVNYCSQNYKNLYQVSGFKMRPASQVVEAFESLTDSGFIRRLSVIASPSELEALVADLRRQHPNDAQWSLDPEVGELYFHESLFDDVGLGDRRLGVTYFVCRPANNDAQPGDFGAIALGAGKSVFVERKRAGQFRVSTAAGIQRFRSLCIDKQPKTRALARLFVSKDLEGRKGERPSRRAWANFVVAERWPLG